MADPEIETQLGHIAVVEIDHEKQRQKYIQKVLVNCL